MNLMRWDPFGDMDSLFNRVMPSSFGLGARLASQDDRGATLEWSPKADISETDHEYLVRAELPAVKKEDIKVSVDGGMLTIEGERKQRSEEKNEKQHRVESFYGNFTRSFVLPENVDLRNIKCESENGILTVHMPKTAVDKPKSIEIKVQ